METKNIIAVLALVIVVISLVNIAVTVTKFGNVMDGITGFATTGYVNLTVSSNIILNVSPDDTTWGTGIVNTSGGFNNATLKTNKNMTATVVGGNWSTAGVTALGIQNLGSSNVTLSITSDKDAASFIGGTYPEFMWNFTNKDTNGCVTWNITNNVYHNVTTNSTPVCQVMGYGAFKRQIWVDTKIVVPDNAVAGAKGVTFTVSGVAAP